MIQLIYVTFASKADALTMAEGLLAEKLIACANILPPIQSIYVWEGAVQQQEETVALFKTVHAQAAADYITQHHPYDTPCILTLNAEANAAFAGYIGSSF